jgi:hypothetical protein
MPRQAGANSLGQSRHHQKWLNDQNVVPLDVRSTVGAQEKMSAPDV